MKKSLIILVCLALLGGMGNLSFATGRITDTNLTGKWTGTVIAENNRPLSLTMIVVSQNSMVQTIILRSIDDINTYTLAGRDGFIATDGRQVILGYSSERMELQLSDDGSTLTGFRIFNGNRDYRVELRKVQ